MVPTDFFGSNIIDVLQNMRQREVVVEYSKIEGDEFLKFPEEGFYLQAKNGTGSISNCRIYFEARDQCFPSKHSTRGIFGELETIDDFAQKFGSPMKDIRAVKIPGAAPTLPGKIFAWEDRKLSVYSEDNDRVAYIHIKEI